MCSVFVVMAGLGPEEAFQMSFFRGGSCRSK